MLTLDLQTLPVHSFMSKGAFPLIRIVSAALEGKAKLSTYELTRRLVFVMLNVTQGGLAWTWD